MWFCFAEFFHRPGQLSETAGNKLETNSLTSLALPGHVLTRKKKNRSNPENQQKLEESNRPWPKKTKKHLIWGPNISSIGWLKKHRHLQWLIWDRIFRQDVDPRLCQISKKTFEAIYLTWIPLDKEVPSSLIGLKTTHQKKKQIVSPPEVRHHGFSLKLGPSKVKFNAYLRV